MGKFKVNKRVRIRHHEKPEYIGRIGKIIERAGKLIDVYLPPRYPDKPPPGKTLWYVKIEDVEELVLCKAEELEQVEEGRI